MARNAIAFDEASPLDEDFFTGDFRRLLDEGETIETASVTISPETGLAVDGDVDISESRVTVKLKDGGPGESYVITFSIETSISRKLSRPVVVRIAEENTPVR